MPAASRLPHKSDQIADAVRNLTWPQILGSLPSASDAPRRYPARRPLAANQRGPRHQPNASLECRLDGILEAGHGRTG